MVREILRRNSQTILWSGDAKRLQEAVHEVNGGRHIHLEHRGELLNSESEWQQVKVIRTTIRVAQGGAEILQPTGRVE